MAGRACLSFFLIALQYCDVFYQASIVWLHRVFVAGQDFSSRRTRGSSPVAVQVSHCSGFSCCIARALGLGLRSCDAWA